MKRFEKKANSGWREGADILKEKKHLDLNPFLFFFVPDVRHSTVDAILKNQNKSVVVPSKIYGGGNQAKKRRGGGKRSFGYFLFINIKYISSLFKLAKLAIGQRKREML